jgi:hypothetical protein
MRLELQYGNRLSASNPVKGSVSFQDALSIDYIRIVRAPEIWRVRGCLDKYYDNTNYQAPTYNVTTVVDYINGHLPIYSFIKNALSQQYATTYDCPTTGGVQLTIDGINFGPQVNVWVGGQPCPVSTVEYSATSGRQQTVMCTLPARNTATMVDNPVRVRVQNAIVPGLFQEVPGVEYRIAPAAPFPPTGQVHLPILVSFSTYLIFFFLTLNRMYVCMYACIKTFGSNISTDIQMANVTGSILSTLLKLQNKKLLSSTGRPYNLRKKRSKRRCYCAHQLVQ